jgi:hypothetical protein
MRGFIGVGGGRAPDGYADSCPPVFLMDCVIHRGPGGGPVLPMGELPRL